MTDCGCGCGGAGSPAARTENPPGQQTLARRVSTHGSALESMRSVLADPENSLQVRALAQQPPDDPAIALLDAWAVVADTVAFYNERIATEGFLRTATERLSVRELARMLGYELRPGVAAQTELAFVAEMAATAPAVVDVPAGTPVQSIPAQGELPQTFETTDALEVRGVWNAIPAVGWQRQPLGYQAQYVWLRGTGTSATVGDRILIVGSERARARAALALGVRRGVFSRDTSGDDEKWDFRRVTAVTIAPDGLKGWVRLTLDRPIGYRRSRPLVAEHDVTAHLMTERTSLFGWNAPDPDLMADEQGATPGASGTKGNLAWDGYSIVSRAAPDVIELDGDRTAVLLGTWLVLEQPGLTESFLVMKTQADGATKFGLSGKLTRVRVDVTENLDRFTRPQTLVHAGSVPLDAAEMPLETPIGASSTLVVELTDPPLPPDRLVLVTGTDSETGATVSEPAVVLVCTVMADGRTMTLTLDRTLRHSYVATSTKVSGNVAVATHGETVGQVLGSGDGTAPFPQFSLRRSPLTYVRSQTPEGASAELSVRVDGVEWTLVPSLDSAEPTSRVYTVRQGEDGESRLVFGDGDHGARLPTGGENVTATYRVGIGASGALVHDQLSLLARKPLGIKSVANPSATHDWAPEEDTEEARLNAPLRVRTLDRAVSVADYEDFARAYAGIGKARADLVWNGTHHVVVVSLMAVGATEASEGLIRDLRTTIDAARDPSAALEILRGEPLWFGVRVEIEHDPAYERDPVVAAVKARLSAALAPSGREFATAATAAAVLVLVHDVPGVRACTMPRLLALPNPPSPDPALPPVLPPDPGPDGVRDDLLLARPARWDSAIRPAQLLGLATGGVEVGVMTR